jgi:hypothetical protein
MEFLVFLTDNVIPAPSDSPLKAYWDYVGNKARLWRRGRFLFSPATASQTDQPSSTRSVFTVWALQVLSYSEQSEDLINMRFISRQAQTDTAASVSEVQIFISVIPPTTLHHFFLFASPTMSSSVPVDSFIIHGSGEREIVHLPRVPISICHLLNEIRSHLAGIWWLTLIMTLPGDVSSPGGSSMVVGLIDLLWEPANREQFSKDRNRHDVRRPLH